MMQSAMRVSLYVCLVRKWRRQNKISDILLFQTKCVVKQRSHRMIIDGGSYNNLTSSDMVEKLALSTKPHPHPYYIQWLKNSGKTKVTRLV
jgi:hypothetical protein